MYTGSGRKPQLLLQLESYVKEQLQDISPHEPKLQELKLQVYRNVFSCFISTCKTYQPLLSAIKKEYENTLVHQQDQIQELEPLRFQMKLMTEECDRKFQMQKKEVQAEIDTLKRQKQQLQKDIEAMKEKEKTVQTVVDHLQTELSNQYLQYRKECDARKVLIWQLNDLLRDSVKRPADGDTDCSKDSVEPLLALKVCREDLTKTQEELNKLKAEYWDVVPRRNWDSLEQTHKQTLLQLKTLQGDFDLMKREYDILLENCKKDSMETKTCVSASVQTEEALPEGQHQLQSEPLEDQIDSDASESTILTIQLRQGGDHETAKYDKETDEHVTKPETEADCSSDDIIPHIPP